MGGFSEPRGTYQQMAMNPAQAMAMLLAADERGIKQEVAESLFQQRMQDLQAQAQKHAEDTIYGSAASTLGIPGKELERYRRYMPGLEDVKTEMIATSRPEVVESRTGLLAPFGLGKTKRSIHVPQLTPGLHAGVTQDIAKRGDAAIRAESLSQLDAMVANRPELAAAGNALRSQIERGPIFHPSEVAERLKAISLTAQEGIKETTAAQMGPLDVQRAQVGLQKERAQATQAEEDLYVSQATRKARILATKSEADYKMYQAEIEGLRAKATPETIRLDQALKNADLQEKTRLAHNMREGDKMLWQYREGVRQGMPNPSLLRQAMTFYGLQGAEGIIRMDREQQVAIASLLEKTMQSRLSVYEAIDKYDKDPTILGDMIQKQNMAEYYLGLQTGASTIRLMAAPVVEGIVGATGKPQLGSYEVPTKFAALYLTGALEDIIANAEPVEQANLTALKVLVQRPYLQTQPDLIEKTVATYFTTQRQFIPQGLNPQEVIAAIKDILGVRDTDIEVPFVQAPKGPTPFEKEHPGVLW